MKKIIFILLVGLVLAFPACNDDVLDRPTKTSYVDDPGAFWRNESDLRMYCNEFYPLYFPGYSSGWGVDWAPLRGYNRSDDVAKGGTQINFRNTTPETGFTSTSTGYTGVWIEEWCGNMWNFAWVRQTNILLDRIENVTKPNLTDDAYKHWTGIGHFFRAFEYWRLVISFGDVPYFEEVVGSADLDYMYRNRDPRGFVMDKVYDDLVYAMDNVRVNDGANTINKYVVAAVASNIMLFEGTWQKYHNLDQVRAKKYLELAVSAAEVVMNSGKYEFTSDFKSLFGSRTGLGSNKEVIMWRNYVAGRATHHIASYSNGIETYEGELGSANLQLIKAFICNDGQPWQNSTVAGADQFNVANLAKTRDPRFDASFLDVVRDQAPTMLYCNKFIDRRSQEDLLATGQLPLATYPEYNSNTNTNSFPCLRLAEVVLNWIEAKAVLAEFFGGPAVTQADLDKSINAIRNRPLDTYAITKGVKKTDPLKLAALPNDPVRDTDVSALMWEIRRERRMEFAFEHTRLLDLRRWAKILDYMDNNKYPDTMFGPWIDFPTEFPNAFTGVNKTNNTNVLKVRKADGTMVTYDGTNDADMVGFFQVKNAIPRRSFGAEVYLAPVSKTLIQAYKDQGYTLTQTPGWENK